MINNFKTFFIAKLTKEQDNMQNNLHLRHLTKYGQYSLGGYFISSRIKSC